MPHKPAVSSPTDIVAELGECPVWNAEDGLLYWEDIDGHRIHRLDPDSGTSESMELPGRPGSFAFTSNPAELVVATETDLVRVGWGEASSETIASVEDAGSGNRLNDGRCDHAGRFVVGTMWPDGSARRFTGGLYRVSDDGAVETLETDVGIPNGLVFDPDRSRMYWADTFHETIWVWDYDLDTGERRNRRVFFDMSSERGLPDGACLDADGCYWSAAVHGWALLRITPDGVIDRRIDLPVQKPSMPAFGGTDLSTIFVTSIGDGGTMPSAPGSDGFEPGCLLAVDAGVQGVPEPRFGA